MGTRRRDAISFFLLSLFSVTKVSDPGFFLCHLSFLSRSQKTINSGPVQQESVLLRIKKARPLSAVDWLVGRDNESPGSSFCRTNQRISQFQDRLIRQQLGQDQDIAFLRPSIAKCDRPWAKLGLLANGCGGDPSVRSDETAENHYKAGVFQREAIVRVVPRSILNP